jgi:DNA-binding NtrC family response regulator
MANILLIDDDADLARYLRKSLEQRGNQVACLERAEHGPGVLATGAFDLVLLDNHLPGMTGIEFLELLQQQGLDVPVILMTGYATIGTAIQATQLRVLDYVIKPTGDHERLLRELEPALSRALRLARPVAPVALPGADVPEDTPGPVLLGSSKAMVQLGMLIVRAADSDLPVLLEGETGTGKELVAQAIHTSGPRRQRPFVPLSCANLSEGELFGQEPGAFAGADKLLKGWLEHAQGGTLFLDQVEELSLALQAKLLRVLESHELFRLGSNQAIQVDVRLLAATTEDLQAAVRAGTVRKELFFRLKGIPIHLPPLREREGDLQLLTEHFLTKFARVAKRPSLTLHESAWARLRGYSWPGNITELQNCIGRAVLVCRGTQITVTDLELDERASAEGEISLHMRRAITAALQGGHANLGALLRQVLSQELLVILLAETGGDQEKAARVLGAPLSELLQAGSAKAGQGPKPEPISFQAQALIMIANHPDWNVERIGKALGCSKAKLYRDEIVRRALLARGSTGYRPPAGYKDADGTMDAFD